MPTVGFEAPVDILPPFSVTTVAVDALRIRENPRLSAVVVGTAGKGELIYVSNYRGPVMADGVDWYPVTFAAGYREWPEVPDPRVSGWAAGGSGGQRYLELVPPGCPGKSPDLAMLTGLSAWERLACLGDRPVTIEGTYGCGGCGGTMVGDFQPTWLAYPGRIAFLWVEWRTGTPLTLSFDPTSGLVPPSDGAVVEVTGHFNDQASATCTMTRYDLDQVFAIEAASAQLYCREQFVVDGERVIGTDPKYPGA
jgi:hypothetical protein